MIKGSCCDDVSNINRAGMVKCWKSEWFQVGLQLAGGGGLEREAGIGFSEGHWMSDAVKKW